MLTLRPVVSWMLVRSSRRGALAADAAEIAAHIQAWVS
jgi:hypothetical protein